RGLFDVDHGDESALGLDVRSLVVGGDVEASAEDRQALETCVSGEDGASGAGVGGVACLTAHLVDRERVHLAFVFDGLEDVSPLFVGGEAEVEHVPRPLPSPALSYEGDRAGAGREPVTRHEPGGSAIVVDPGENVDVRAVAAGGYGNGYPLGGDRVQLSGIAGEEAGDVDDTHLVGTTLFDDKEVLPVEGDGEHAGAAQGGAIGVGERDAEVDRTAVSGPFRRGVGLGKPVADVRFGPGRERPAGQAKGKQGARTRRYGEAGRLAEVDHASRRGRAAQPGFQIDRNAGDGRFFPLRGDFAGEKEEVTKGREGEICWTTPDVNGGDQI